MYQLTFLVVVKYLILSDEAHRSEDTVPYGGQVTGWLGTKQEGEFQCLANFLSLFPLLFILDTQTWGGTTHIQGRPFFLS